MSNVLIIAFLTGIALGILIQVIISHFRKTNKVKTKVDGVVALFDGEAVERFKVYRQSNYEPRFWRKFQQSLGNLRTLEARSKNKSKKGGS